MTAEESLSRHFGVEYLHAEEADAFAALVRLAFAGLELLPPPSALRVTGGDLRDHLASGAGGFVAGAMRAGLLWAELEGGLYVSRLAVHPDHRRKGLAACLLRAAEAEAGRRSLPRLWLSTRLAAASNRRLFGGLGFVEGLQHAHPGYQEPTYVEMEKQLGPASEQACLRHGQSHGRP